ncbi:hypothetical protein [Pseudooceanicola nanhaiensis]
MPVLDWTRTRVIRPKADSSPSSSRRVISYSSMRPKPRMAS